MEMLGPPHNETASAPANAISAHETENKANNKKTKSGWNKNDM